MTLRVGISWLAPLLFGLAATLLAMVTELGSPMWFRSSPRPRLSLPQDPVPSLDPEKLSALTRVAATRTEPASPLATQPTALHLRARGTMLGQFVDWVAIEDLDTGKMQSYAVGDVVKGATIVAISRSLITLREWNETTYLEVSGLNRVIAARPPGLEPGPSQISPGRFSVSRREVEQQLSDMGALASAARVVPSGQGFKIFAIRPGSFVEKLGIQNGDKVARVNGVELSSVDAVFEQLTRLRTSAHIELELERNGAKVTQSYEVQ